MSEEIGDRERRLAAATQNLRDLFDHMGQAIVAFDREGKVRGAVSRQATKVFAMPDLDGEPILQLLFGTKAESEAEAQAFVEWQENAFDIALEDWSSFAELAPKEVTLQREEAARWCRWSSSSVRWRRTERSTASWSSRRT